MDHDLRARFTPPLAICYGDANSDRWIQDATGAAVPLESVLAVINGDRSLVRPEVAPTLDEAILYEAAWELRKVILAYEAWVANPYSGARAKEMSIHLCSARDWLEKRDLKHLGVGNLEELSKALKVRLDRERGPQGESK